ncbi:hypothetical protein, partial [Methylomonas rivi]
RGQEISAQTRYNALAMPAASGGSPPCPLNNRMENRGAANSFADSSHNFVMPELCEVNMTVL